MHGVMEYKVDVLLIISPGVFCIIFVNANIIQLSMFNIRPSVFCFVLATLVIARPERS